MMDKWPCVGGDVVIGYEGENNAREIRLGIGKWRQAWPTAVPRMIIERETDGEGGKESYIAVTEMDGDTMVWKVKSFDLEHPGYMKMWIVFVDEGEEIVGMTPPTQVNVLDGPDMIDGDTPPEMTPPWMVEVIAAANRIDQTAAEIPQTIEAALQAAKDSGEFDGPPGEKGEPGYTPTLKVERVEDGVNVTATNADGEETAKVYDGASSFFVVKFPRKGGYADKTQEEVRAAMASGKVCIALDDTGEVYICTGEEKNGSKPTETAPTFRRMRRKNYDFLESGDRQWLDDYCNVQIRDNGRMVWFGSNGGVEVPNPMKLTLKQGENQTSYDGSEAVTVEIPSADVLVARLVKTDSGYTSDVPYADIVAAKDSGKTCIALNSLGNAYVYIGVKPYNEDDSVAAATFSAIERNNNGLFEYNWIQITEDGRAHAFGLEISAANPYPLTINGKSYDGSEAVNLTIEGGTGGTGGGSGLPEPEGAHLQLVTDKDGKWSQVERLAYEYGSTAEIIPESEAILIDENESMYVLTAEPSQPIEEGKSYVVTWNGVEYRCTSQTIYEYGFPSVALGNVGMFTGGTNTGEPFIIIYSPPEITGEEGIYFIVLPIDESTDIRVKIVFNYMVIKKVEKKFLPDELYVEPIILTPSDDDKSFTSSVGFEEAYALDENTLQSAIRIEYPSETGGMSVCAVAKIGVGNTRAIQMLCVGFNDAKMYRVEIIQWWYNGAISVEDQCQFIPYNNDITYESIPVISSQSNNATSWTIPQVKELLGVTPFIVTITNTDGTYTADHYTEEIYAAHEAGKKVYAVYDDVMFDLVFAGATQSTFTLLSIVDDGGTGTIPKAEYLLIGTDSVKRIEHVLMTEDDKAEIEDSLVSLSEEISDVTIPAEEDNSIPEQQIALDNAMHVGRVDQVGRVDTNATDYDYTDKIKLNGTKSFTLIAVNTKGTTIHPAIRYVTPYDADGNVLSDLCLQNVAEAKLSDGRTIVMDASVDSVIITMYKAEQYTEKTITLLGAEGDAVEYTTLKTDRLSGFNAELDPNEVRYGNHKGGVADYTAKTAICTRGYVKPFVKSITVVDADYQLAVCIFNNGVYEKTVAWIGNGSSYTFDHAKQYKLYIGRVDEEKVLDFDAARKSVMLTMSSADVLYAYNRLTAQMDVERENTRNALEYMMRRKYDVAYANAPAPNGLIAYTGNSQIVHPKVLYIPGKFGGHRYWMAYTPYPWAIDTYENPCIAYSDDGYEWTNINGNPLDDPAGNGYNSDTHLVYIEATGTMEVWYRYVGDYDTPPVPEIIYRQTSTDGVNWTAKEVVINNTSGDYVQYLSPAVIYDGSKYKMWVVNGTDRAIHYYESTNLSSFNEIRTIDLDYMDGEDEYRLWHIDVIEDNGQTVLLGMGKTSESTTLNQRWTLFLATSEDNATFTAPAVVMRGNPYGWDKQIYRSTIVNVNGEYRIYYSAQDETQKHGFGLSTSRNLSEFVGKIY